MKNKHRKTIVLAAVCAAAVMIGGCGENTQTYDQAGRDLEQGSYTYALEGFEQSVAEGIMVAESYRGAGLCHLRMGEYEAAAESFSLALAEEKLHQSLRQDLLYYRATAYYKSENYTAAMADCQTLSEDFEITGETAFLTGCVALALDGYDEARAQFTLAFETSHTYDMAIRIYQTYLQEGMEADGTGYLEDSLNTDPKTAEDYCDRGRVYYYMEDYEKASQELTTAINMDSTDAILLQGMVYMAKGATSNARAMYQEYVNKAENPSKGYNGLALCDISEGKYEAALENIKNGIPTATTEEMQGLLYNEIVVYEKQLDFETAYQKAKEYSAMFPEDEQAVRELTFLKSRIEDME